MTISDNGINFIKSFEKFVDHIYLCEAKVKTIGYGHAVRPREIFKEPISKEYGEEILRKDLITAMYGVKRYINIPLTQGQYDALVSFSFNLGNGSLQRSSLRMKINRGEYLEAANEFLKWIYAGGKKSKGLLKRRIKEREIFLNVL